MATGLFTKQNIRVAFLQIDPTYTNGIAIPVTCPVKVQMQSTYLDDSIPVKRLDGACQAVSFDLVDPTLAAVTITAAGKTVTYPQLASLIRQAALDRANAAGIQ